MNEAIGNTSPVLCVFDPESGPYCHDRMNFGFLEQDLALSKRGYNRFERQFSVLSLI